MWWSVGCLEWGSGGMWDQIRTDSAVPKDQGARCALVGSLKTAA